MGALAGPSALRGFNRLPTMNVQLVHGREDIFFGFIFDVEAFRKLPGAAVRIYSCEAVGGYVDSSGAFVPLGARWNGAAWHAQPAPNPARASTNYLGGVSCPAPSDCTAAGQGNGSGTPITLGG
jgi:hypothetical protein